MKKKITLKYYGHRYPEQLLMRAANMVSAVTPTDGLTVRPNTKSATIYADPIQARAIAKQVKKSTGVTVIVNLPDNVGRFIDFLVAEGVFAEWLLRTAERKAPIKVLAWLGRCHCSCWIDAAFVWPPTAPHLFWRKLADKWDSLLLTTNK